VVVIAMSELPTVDQQELEAVSGGGILASLGQGALSGALSGAAQGIQSGGLGNGGVWKGALAGALQGLAGALQGGGGGGQPPKQ
jgi:hypothetical protein